MRDTFWQVGKVILNWNKETLTQLLDKEVIKYVMPRYSEAQNGNRTEKFGQTYKMKQEMNF